MKKGRERGESQDRGAAALSVLAAQAAAKVEKELSRELRMAYQELEEKERELARAYEKLKELDKLKTDFMNVAAHELKTPIVSMAGYLELLEEAKLSEEDRENLRVVTRNVDRLQKLVSDVLDISKLDSGVMKFRMEKIQLTSLIKNSVEDTGQFAREKGITLQARIPPKLPPVYADPVRLTQVLTNLINNAVKFTERGGVTVEAWTDGKGVSVAVRDTGIGIAGEHIPKLFTKFFQVDTSIKRKYGGTGLGLAICKQIVKAHGGKIWAESTLGKGSTFYFTLPTWREHEKKRGKSFISKGAQKKEEGD